MKGLPIPVLNIDRYSLVAAAGLRKQVPVSVCNSTRRCRPWEPLSDSFFSLVPKIETFKVQFQCPTWASHLKGGTLRHETITIHSRKSYRWYSIYLACDNPVSFSSRCALSCCSSPEKRYWPASLMNSSRAYISVEFPVKQIKFSLIIKFFSPNNNK